MQLTVVVLRARLLVASLLLLVASLLLLVRSAHAQEPALEWQAPSTCPSREVLLWKIAARVEDEAFRNAAPKLRIVVRIETAPGGYVLLLDTQLDGAFGKRRLEAARCEELIDAAALHVALAIELGPVHEEQPIAAEPPAFLAAPQPELRRDSQPAAEPALQSQPQVAPQPQPPSQAQAQPAPPVVAAPPTARKTSTAAPTQRRAVSAGRPLQVRLWVRPLLLLDLGTLPELGVGPALQAGVRIEDTSLELGASYLVDQTLTSSATSEGVGQLGWVSGSIGVCQGFRVGRGELAPCLRAELGRLSGSGSDLDGIEAAGGATWLAALGGLRASLPLTDAIFLGLELDIGLPLLASAFTVDGLGELHRTSSVVGRLCTGVELRF